MPKIPQKRCPFCGHIMFNCNILSEGPGKTVKFNYCNGCSRGYRTNFLGDGRKFILHTYITECMRCEKKSDPFDIDDLHPTTTRLKESFTVGSPFLNFCYHCNEAGDAKVIKFDTKEAEEST